MNYPSETRVRARSRTIVFASVDSARARYINPSRYINPNVWMHAQAECLVKRAISTRAEKRS